MSKFHINKHGVPAPCKAKPGNCPLGGDETHFGSQEEAQTYVDKKNEQEYKLMPDVLEHSNSKNTESKKKLTPAQKKAKEKKEFEERLTSKLGKYWRNRDGTPNEKMVKHCLKNTKYVEIGNSFIDVADSKPKIHNQMWYDDETKSPEVNFENFYNYNVRMEMPDYYEMTGRSYSGDGKLKMIPQYDGVEDLELALLTYEDDSRFEAREISEDELEEINNGIKEVRENYEKRLKAYYKRYKDKIIATGYWSNR